MTYILKKGVKKDAHNIGGNDSSKDDQVTTRKK